MLKNWIKLKIVHPFAKWIIYPADMCIIYVFFVMVSPIFVPLRSWSHLPKNGSTWIRTVSNETVNLLLKKLDFQGFRPQRSDVDYWKALIHGL